MGADVEALKGLQPLIIMCLVEIVLPHTSAGTSSVAAE